MVSDNSLSFLFAFRPLKAFCFITFDPQATPFTSNVKKGERKQTNKSKQIMFDIPAGFMLD